MQNKTYRLYMVLIVMMISLIVTMTCIPDCLSVENLEDEFFKDKMNVRVTLDLQDTSLRDVLKMLSVQSGLNFISSEAVADRKITLYLDNVMLKDALDKIFMVNNLSYELDTENNIFLVKDWGKPSIELETRVYTLKYASATNSKMASGTGSLKEVVNNLISSQGRIVEDPSTNSIIITDMPSKFPVIEQVINKLDIPVAQVMIEVEILDVDKSDVDKMGLKFTDTNWFVYTGPNLGGTYFPFNSNSFEKAGPKTAPTPANWTMTGFGFVADFLSSRTSTRFLARPKLLVLNNETAQLKLSSNEAIGIITELVTSNEGATTSNQTVDRTETGVVLKVTPQISMATGEVTMVIEPIIKEAVESIYKINNQNVKDVEERSIKSTVRMKDGETIILGGLLREKEPLTLTKVPFLGDIPILGMLFRHKSSGPRKNREILVFLTPRIMRNFSQTAENGVVSRRMIGAREQEPLNNSRKSEIVSRTLGIYETK